MGITAKRTATGFEVQGCGIASVRSPWRVDFRLNEVVVAVDGHEEVVLMRKPSPAASALFQALHKGQGRATEAAVLGVVRATEAALLARQED